MRKKNILTCVLAASIVFSLTGCDSDKSPKVVAVDEIITEQAYEETLTTVILDEPYWNVGMHSFCKDNIGNYYYIDENDYCLMVFNPETKEAKPVCEKEDCDHLEMDCMAYVDPFMYCMNSIYYYNGKLYIISRYDSRYCLIQMNTDGTGRKNITTLGYVDETDNENIYNMAFEGNYVYYVERKFGTITGDDFSTILFRQNLNGGDYDVVVGLSQYDSNAPARIKTYGSLVFYEVGSYDEKTGLPVYSGVYAYDPLKGIHTEVVTGNISDYTLDMVNNVMYMYITGGGLYSLESGGNPKLIQKAEDNQPRQISWDGNYIYMSIYNDDEWTVSDSIDIIDSTGKLVQKVESTGWMTPYEICYGDDRFMFATEDFTGIKVYVYYEKDDVKGNNTWSEIDNWFLENE